MLFFVCGQIMGLLIKLLHLYELLLAVCTSHNLGLVLQVLQVAFTLHVQGGLTAITGDMQLVKCSSVHQ